MLKQNLLSIFIIFVLVPFYGISQNNPILFRQVSPNGGFTYGAIRTITQDSIGCIWFGTEHGLFRYDSKDIKKHIMETNNSLSDDDIQDILTSSDGKLWVVAREQTLLFNYKTHQFSEINYTVSPETKSISTIRKLIENKQGQLFALFYAHIGVFDNQNNNEIHILPFTFKNNDNLTAITFDDQNNLYIGTGHGYIYKSEAPYDTLKLLCRHRTEAVLTLCTDNNTLWVGYDWGGADHINGNGTIIDHFDQNQTDNNYIPHNRVRQILKDDQGQIWLATYNGIVLISNKGNQVIRKNEYNKLPSNSIYALFNDTQHGVWIGTWSGGLCYYNKNENHFLHIKHVAPLSTEVPDVVSSFAEDKHGNIWIGSENGGLSSLDPKSLKMAHFQLPEEMVGTSNIKCLAVDHQNRLWIGTFSKGLLRFNQQTQKFESLNILNSQRVHVYDICPTDDGLWLASFSHGLLFYDFEQKQITVRHNNSGSLTSNTARCLLIDSYGGIWVGTNYGLNYLPKGSTKFQRFLQTEKGDSLSNNEVFSLAEDHNGKIWIGTGGGGVDCYEPSTGKMFNVSTKEGLSGYNVYGILEDEQNLMWFSTESGISCYDPSTSKIRIFNEDDGLQGNQFNPGASFKSSNGLFFFGGANGYNLIDPANIGLNLFEPEAQISEMLINNKPIEDYEKTKFDNITTLSEITLPYNDNSLSFEFIATNYILPKRNHFKYRLVNYNDQWINAGTEGKATFTKIPPGNYTLELSASNNDGVWSSKITKLGINIRPPFWLTGWAFLVYFLALVSAAFFILREIATRQKLKNDLLIERVKNEKEEELHQAKMKLFTNISHEFKTPLTLILSPLDHLLNQNRFDSDTDDHLNMIKRNAERLNQLINQIIDFRKIELGKSTFNPDNVDLIKLTSNICDFFKVYAKDKQIDFSFQTPVSELFHQLDEEKYEKIIFNFLSNAFKYTTDGGRISVSLHQHNNVNKLIKTGYSTVKRFDEGGIEIRVEDNGPGMSQDEIPLIFNRFHQGARSMPQGTGIGLHLCKEYAAMHGGAIYVESAPGKGTRFSLILPLKTPVKQDNFVTVKNMNETNTQPEVIEETKTPSHTILIVEDHLEMQKFIRNIFQKEYRTLVASNGSQGFKIASEFSPDLVISDVMMPVQDGFEFCSKLKEDIQTSHIPVILLTALSETDKHISGLQTGADAYITKPFDEKLLKAQVKNLLDSRKKLQETFVKSQQEWEDNTTLMPADKNLVNKAIRIIEKRMQDPAFSVEMLAAELNISRSSLHRKITALTNQSSTEFIRYVRLKKAIQLMKDGSYNIDEIGYAVGFNSHSYFTQSFKKQFGKTPSAYMNDLKN
ncbi:Signal transduction histidine kinase [Draconibacterium orientale]|uniref:histidine kinase n=1 Tax=Draconibacterium orientale TaxID=1168034 RepID=X5DLJ4_9BACT|nr:hybrid sensor histidine kinase/response regulator transcription factor [Draconibacterium orientale]AHW62119.1 hypothetical protein FH5T_15730 [Draconibacterium orientale]SET04734.1 Signal transduction histidine kinase [Draconibacterium orientale]